MFNKKDNRRDEFMLDGSFAKQGYDWWWHSFTAIDSETGEEKPFFIEFYTCNPALGGDEPVFGQLPSTIQLCGNKPRPDYLKPSYLMVKAGAWGEDACQLHRFFGWNSVRMHSSAPYSIAAADCYASDNVLKGSINITEEEAKAHPEYMCDSGSLSWELTIDKQVAFNVGYGASTPLRSAKAFEMYWHAEGMKTAFSGKVILNGRTYEVKPESCYGYSDKNWGKNFTSPWVWLSSNCLTSKKTGAVLKNSVFDIGGGRPKIYFVPLNRKLLSAFWYEGKCYEFNFSKFWTVTRTKFGSKETDEEIIWHVKQENLTHIMETEVHCKKKDMLFVNYESPDGTKRHNRLWNGGNGTGTIRLLKKHGKKLELVDEILATHIGCEYGEYDD